MAKGDNIQERLITFAVRAIEICSELPKSKSGRHIADQLLRCATSPAPNYGEARGAESKKDFIHKLGIVLKELNESAIWCEIIKRSKMLPERTVKSFSSECAELSKIISVSIRTVKMSN